MTSSRKLAEACRRNVVFMALSADTRPHFTTIAAFVRQLKKEIVALFRDVLLYCEELGLIGKGHFAIDGCKLPSNASKQWSGTHEELRERQEKMERAAGEIVRRHRERDEREKQGPLVETARGPKAPLPAIEAMRRKIDSVLGRLIYGRRIATVEPVFANVQNKGMRRFTLRGRRKVDTQWKLFTLVHNIEKIANYAAT